MAHRLNPRENLPHLSPAAVIRHLKDEFEHVDVDREAGTEHVGDMIVQFLRMGAPREVIEQHTRAQAQAAFVVVADDPSSEDAYLSFVIMPDEGLLIGYHSAQHEAQAHPLLLRCAEALGYEIELV